MRVKTILSNKNRIFTVQERLKLQNWSLNRILKTITLNLTVGSGLNWEIQKLRFRCHGNTAKMKIQCFDLYLKDDLYLGHIKVLLWSCWNQYRQITAHSSGGVKTEKLKSLNKSPAIIQLRKQSHSMQVERKTIFMKQQLRFGLLLSRLYRVHKILVDFASALSRL